LSILVRPVREQLEHDRLIRHLHTKFRRRFDVGINPGPERNVAAGTSTAYPDLILFAPGRGRRVQTVIEVETGESVNHLEALSEWSHFSRLRAGFHLYVPSGMVEVARRLCSDNDIPVTEIWSYHGVGDEVRFTLIHRSRESGHMPKVKASTRAAAGQRRKAAPAPPRKAAARAKATKTRAKTAKKATPARGQKRR
jgi:hypothetical protein